MEEAPHEPQAPAPGRGESVLLIDDEAELTEEVGDYLEGLGYTITTANSGEAGLAILEKANPAVIVCDVSMPGMNGHDVLKAIRRRTDRLKNVPFLFLTAYGAHDDHLTALGFGADDFIAKPEKLSIIAARIRSRLDQAQRFETESLERVAIARKRIADNAARREQKLIAVIKQLATNVDDVGGTIAAIATMADPGTDLSELALGALKSTEHAAGFAKTASILARMPTAPLALSPRPCDVGAIIMETIRAMAGGTLSFHAEAGHEIDADPAQIKAIAANVAAWVQARFPNAMLKAEPAQAGRDCIITLRLSAPYHRSEEIAGAWNHLAVAARRIAANPDGPTEVLAPADAAMLELIESIDWSGGTTSAKTDGADAVISIRCVHT